MPATIIPFRSRNPETDLLSRRNAEEAKRRLREVGEASQPDFRRLGPNPLTRSEYLSFHREFFRDWFNPTHDGGAA